LVIEALRLYLANLLSADRRCRDCFETEVGKRERQAASMTLFVFVFDDGPAFRRNPTSVTTLG
jgi:hypothetical protein